MKARKAGNLPTTDMGNGKRFVRHHSRDTRFCDELGKWFIWDGVRWKIDNTQEVLRLARMTVERIIEEARRATNDDLASKLKKHAISSQALHRLKNMVKLASIDLHITREDFDNDPYLLNLSNGTLNLKTGEFQKPRRHDYLTRLAPVEYDSDATCPRFIKFLNRIFEGEREKISYVQRVVGYLLTGDTSEQCFFIFYGKGSNGKTTLTEVIRAMMGDYSQQADFRTFLGLMADKAVRNDLAALQFSRFVAAAEAGKGQTLNEVLLKQLTGGESISTRFLYQEHFEYRPAFKTVLISNHRPKIVENSHAIWRRVRLIPFNVTISNSEADKRLTDKLKEETPGVLNWALEGCRDWIENGLGEPAEIIDATKDYHDENDSIGTFLKECCRFISTSREDKGEVWQEYRNWCRDRDRIPSNRKELSMELKERGCIGDRSGGTRIWKGIKLKEL